MQYAAIVPRGFAFLIDFVLLRLLSRVIGEICFIITHDTELKYYFSSVEVNPNLLWGRFALDVFLMCAYFFVCEGFLVRATLGKMIMKLRVAALVEPRPLFVLYLVRALYKSFPLILMLYVAYGQMVSNLIAAYNYTMPTFHHPLQKGLILWAILLVSYGMAFFSPQKQTLHDKMAKTVVIKTDETGLLKIIYTSVSRWVGSLRRA